MEYLPVMRKALLFVLSVSLLAPLVALACAQPATPLPTPTQLPPAVKETTVPVKRYNAPPAMTINPKAKYTATMKTSQGEIVINLFASEAPKTVNNFVFLSREGYYNGVVFHRIIKGFMVQGGDPTGTGSGGPGYSFADEPVTRDYLAGTIAMANSGPNTNGSQFFIMHQNYALAKNYTIFGQAVKGIEIVDVLANTPVSATGERSKPITPPVILSIDITEELPQS